MNSTYGKQGPPLYSTARLKQLYHSWPSSPQILQRRHFQNSDFFSIWIWMRSMHSQFLFLILGFAFVVFFVQFKGCLHHLFSSSYLWFGPRNCYFSLSNRPTYTCNPPLWQPGISPHWHSWSWDGYTVCKQLWKGEENMFSTWFSLKDKKQNSGFLKSAFLSGNRCLSLWDSLVFCGCVGEGLPWSWVVLFKEKWEGQAVGVIF